MTVASMLLVSLCPSFASELHFRTLTVNDGLSQSHVETIAQDRDGYIWLGTAAGLNRFDGYDVTVYKHDSDDAVSLSHDGVSALHVDAQGTVWVGTNGGLNRFVSRTDSFDHWTFDPSDPSTLYAGGVNVITSDRAGFLWVGTEGLNRVDPRTGTVTRHPIGHLSSRSVQAIHEDSRERLWVGVGNFEMPALPGDGLYRFDRTSETFVRHALESSVAGARSTISSGVTSIAEDAHGRLWVGTWGGNLYRLDEEQETFIRFSSAATKGHEFVRRILPDPTGGLWVITSRSADWYNNSGRTDLLELDPAAGTARRFSAADAAHAQTDVFLDRAGTLWLATSGSGAQFGDTVAGQFEHHRREPNNPNSRLETTVLKTNSPK